MDTLYTLSSFHALLPSTIVAVYLSAGRVLLAPGSPVVVAPHGIGRDVELSPRVDHSGQGLAAGGGGRGVGLEAVGRIPHDHLKSRSKEEGR